MNKTAHITKILKIVVVLVLFFQGSFFHVPGCLAQPSTPFLTLNTQMHTGTIERISIDASGKYLLTASDDKTAKLWDATTGDLIRTYRIPIDKGNAGKLFSCALSPDGTMVALGGWTGDGWLHNCSIYIFNAHTGTMIKRIARVPNVICDLEFSPDGGYLAASISRGNGIIIYLTNGWSLFKSLTDYKEDSYNVCFDQTGRLATVCYDGKVRLYDRFFNLINQTNQLAGSQPFSIAFSPDGNKLAVGYEDSPVIEVLDGKSLRLLYRPDITGATSTYNRIGILSFSYDGAYLYGGGNNRKFSNNCLRFQIRCWKDAGRGSYLDIDGGYSGLFDIKSLPGGDILFASSFPDFGRISATGNKQYNKKAETNTYATHDKSHLKTDESGSIIAFKSHGKDAICFSITEKKISPYTSFTNEASFTDKSGNLSISDWDDNPTPKLNGKTLSFIEKNEIAQSVDISKVQNNIILGTDWNLYCLDGAGEKKWEIPGPGCAWAVKITGNGKAVIAAFGDGTIRWYRMSDGKELLALFAHPDNKRWVLWAPSGYYDCSEGAEDLIGWHIDNGFDHEANYYPVSKFRSTYYRPDVISNILETLDEDEALRLANLENNRKMQKTDITRMLPPGVNISYPLQGQEVIAKSVTLKYMLQLPNNEPVISVKAFINGRPAVTQTVLKPAGQQQQITLTIPENDCKISLVAENRFGYSDPAIVSLVWKGRNEAEEMAKPRLYIVAIGISDYKDTNYRLMFGAKDARDFAAAFAPQKGQLYSNVITKILTDKNATRDSIVDALEWLRKETTSRDVAVLFLSGHGVRDNTGEFCFLPVNADLDHILRTCVMSEEINKITGNVPGKMLLFIDACHSGYLPGKGRKLKSPDIPALVNELISAENGTMVIFASSTGNQYSIEDRSWGNGAFTKALVEGIKGRASLFRQNKVTVLSLGTYMAERVKVLTGGNQTPTFTPSGGSDYPIAVVKP